jgi:polysaccharide deacetylase family protein (PEP-CTERM system associated)
MMTLTHCFSVDVEGFCEGMAESFPIPADMVRSQREKDEIASNVDETLDFLDTHQVKGTFFVLGIIAKEQPNVVRRIADDGHEIASHSYEHLRLNNMDPSTVKEVISRSKKVLEDVSGQRVIGFRAPDFSINQQTLYILDIIREAGFVYDSSIYPISGHDVYGVKNAKPEIHKLPNGLIEFPATTYKVLGKSIPALGGGYFRLYPLSLSKFILRSLEKRNQPAMFYIHPYEIGSRYPVFENMSILRKFRHYANIAKPRERFGCLFKEFSFGRASDILRSRGFVA